MSYPYGLCVVCRCQLSPGGSCLKCSSQSTSTRHKPIDSSWNPYLSPTAPQSPEPPARPVPPNVTAAPRPRFPLPASHHPAPASLPPASRPNLLTQRPSLPNWPVNPVRLRCPAPAQHGRPPFFAEQVSAAMSAVEQDFNLFNPLSEFVLERLAFLWNKYKKNEFNKSISPNIVLLCPQVFTVWVSALYFLLPSSKDMTDVLNKISETGEISLITISELALTFELIQKIILNENSQTKLTFKFKNDYIKTQMIKQFITNVKESVPSQTVNPLFFESLNRYSGIDSRQMISIAAEYNLAIKFALALLEGKNVFSNEPEWLFPVIKQENVLEKFSFASGNIKENSEFFTGFDVTKEQFSQIYVNFSNDSFFVAVEIFGIGGDTRESMFLSPKEAPLFLHKNNNGWLKKTRVEFHSLMKSFNIEKIYSCEGVYIEKMKHTGEENQVTFIFPEIELDQTLKDDSNDYLYNFIKECSNNIRRDNKQNTIEINVTSKSNIKIDHTGVLVKQIQCAVISQGIRRPKDLYKIIFLNNFNITFFDLNDYKVITGLQINNIMQGVEPLLENK